MNSQPPPPFEIIISYRHGQAHALLIGDLDLATAPLLASKLHDIDPDSDLVIDMSLLTFVDSTGLGLLVMEHKRLEAHGHELTIYSPTPRVQRLLQITGLDQHLAIEP